MGRRTTRTSLAAAAAAAAGADNDSSPSDSPSPAPQTRTSAATSRARSKKDDSVQAKSIDKQKIMLSSDTGHFSLIRAFHLADLITLMNGFCGVMSVFFSLRHCLLETASPDSTAPPRNLQYLYMALVFLPFALAFDFLDGRVARWRNKSSLMGQELDSLADLISFGVAPAAAAFALGMRTDADSVALAFFVLCGLARLARFNVTVQLLPKDAAGKSKYFEGTPIPTTLGLDAIMGFWLWKGWAGQGSVPGDVWLAGTPFEVHAAVLLFVVHGFLMTSRTIKIPKP